MSAELQSRLARAGRRHRAIAAGVLSGGERETAGHALRGEPPDERSLFEIGSVTKPITGVLLALMELEGEVGLGDPVSEYLPDAEMPKWRDRAPTLEELATHRAALPNVPKGLSLRELAYVGGLSERDPWAALDRESFLGAVRATEPRRPPGGRVGYSSLGYGLLGEALATRAGMPYEALLRERVLAPLGMNETAVEIAESARDRLLGGHSRRGRPRPPLEDLIAPAGGLRSSVAEMLALLEACLRPPEGRLGEALRRAAEPRARLSRRGSIGLGWMIVERRGKPPLTWHNGGTWGFRSFAGFVAEQQAAAIVLSNTARSVDRLGIGLIEAGAASSSP